MLYPPVHGESELSPTAAYVPSPITINVAKRLATQIYNGDKIKSSPDLIRTTASELLHGIFAGNGKKITDIKYNSPDYKMLDKLITNVFVFSAAKNYHELRDLSSAIRDKDRIRSFDEFSMEASKITEKYNKEWLRTEYNQAVAASQSASKWQSFIKNAKEMPFLQYQAVMDSNTRSDHAALHGVIKKISDPFWDKFFPPNGWGCRCEALQMAGSSYKETSDSKINEPDIPPMFRINFGKKGIAFPKSHIYFNRFPEDLEAEAKKMSRSEVRRILSNADKYKKFKEDFNYTDVDFDYKNGGLRARHVYHHLDKKGGAYELHVQTAGFKEGNSVILENERGGDFKQRFTEGLWNDKKFEVAGCETATANNILRGLKHCASKKATEIAVIDFPKVQFDIDTFNQSIAKYKGLEKLKDGQFLRFEKVICVQDELIIFETTL